MIVDVNLSLSLDVEEELAPAARALLAHVVGCLLVGEPAEEGVAAASINLVEVVGQHQVALGLELIRQWRGRARHERRRVAPQE